MPPGLALLLCALGVIYLLYYEACRSKTLSVALWLPTVWLLLAVSRPIGLWLNADSSGLSSDVLEGSAIDRNVRLTLIVLGLAILRRRSSRVGVIVRGNLVLLCIFLWMAASISWSEYPYVSLKRCVRAAGFVVMTLVVLTEDTPGVALNAVIRRVACIAIPLSVVLVKYYPGWGVSFHRWQGTAMPRGITPSKNDLGVIAAYGAVSIAYFLAGVRKAKDVLCDRWYLGQAIVFLMCVYILVPGRWAYSATAWLLALWGLLIQLLFVVFKKRGRLLGLAVVLLSCVMAGVICIGGPLVFGEVFNVVGRDATLTGRTEIWEDIMSVARRNAMCGVGYGGFWVGKRTDERWDLPGDMLNEAHNGYLDVLLELGIVGLGLHVGFIVGGCVGVVRDFGRNSPGSRERCTYLSMVILHNVTESGFFVGVPSLWFFYVSAGMNRREWQQERGSETELSCRRPMMDEGLRVN